MIKLGKYQHYKGGKYQVIGLAKHSETFEDLVVYEALYDNKLSKIWVRPLNSFKEKVEVDGKMIPKFKYLD